METRYEHELLLATTTESDIELVEMVDQDSAANAPLMQGEEPMDSREHDSSHYDARPSSQENELTAPNAFVWALTFAAGISGLLFGYESVTVLWYFLHKC